MGVPESPEPAVVCAGMVQRQVQDQLHVPRVAQCDQFLQVFFRTENGIDPIIVCHVIFMIGRGKKDRRQPDAFNAKAVPGSGIPVVQVIHPVDDAPQIADAVAVGIREGTRKDLVEHAGIVFHFQAVPFPRGDAAQQRQRQRQDHKSLHAYSLLSAAFICIMNHSVFLVK